MTKRKSPPARNKYLRKEICIGACVCGILQLVFGVGVCVFAVMYDQVYNAVTPYWSGGPVSAGLSGK